MPSSLSSGVCCIVAPFLSLHSLLPQAHLSISFGPESLTPLEGMACCHSFHWGSSRQPFHWRMASSYWDTYSPSGWALSPAQHHKCLLLLGDNSTDLVFPCPNVSVYFPNTCHGGRAGELFLCSCDWLYQQPSEYCTNIFSSCLTSGRRTLSLSISPASNTHLHWLLLSSSEPRASSCLLQFTSSLTIKKGITDHRASPWLVVAR